MGNYNQKSCRPNSTKSLFCLVFFIYGIFANNVVYGSNGKIAYAYPMDGITIDGQLQDWPSDMAIYKLDFCFYGEHPRNDEDFNASFRLGYNMKEQALYLSVEVRDEIYHIDTSSNRSWNSQDVLQLFIDGQHLKYRSPVEYFVANDQYRNLEKTNWKYIDLAISKKEDHFIYEYKIKLGDNLYPGRSLGLDLVFIDKDGSTDPISVIGWGSGNRKDIYPEHLGDIIIMDSASQLGSLMGKISWEDGAQTPLPSLVRVQSVNFPSLDVQVMVDSMGNYSTSLPAGLYQINAVDVVGEARVKETNKIQVQLNAGQENFAELLKINPLPEPDLFQDKGILFQSGNIHAETIDHFIVSYMDYYHIPGVSFALVKEGKLAYHQTYGVKNAWEQPPVDEETLFEAASISKPVFGFSVLRLVEKGVLALDTPLYQYFPYEDIAYDERYKLITARMALSHQTGFPNWRSGKLEIQFNPGTQYGYSGEGFVYLGKVIEHLTGRDLDDILQEEVIQPMDMGSTSFSWNDYLEANAATGHLLDNITEKWHPEKPNVAASMHTEAKVFSNFMIGLLHKEGLSDASYQEMFAGEVEIPDESSENSKHSYGLGFHLEESPDGKIIQHGGNNGNFKCKFEIYPEHNIGFIFFANNDQGHQLEKPLRTFLITGKP